MVTVHFLEMATHKHRKYTKLFHCLLSLRLVTLVDAKIIRGIVDTKENWAFLSRFCFQSTNGQYEYWFEYPSDYQIQNLLVYHDDPNQWKSVYKTHLNCKEKESKIESHKIIPLSNTSNAGCRRINIMTDGKFSIQCNSTWKFNSDRSTWWYMAISNCRSQKGLYLNYTIRMLNGDLNDHWFAHFSADEFYIIHISLVFFVLYILLLIISLYVAHGLRERGLFHATFKLYLASVTCQTLGLMFLFVYYNEYAKNGRGIPTLKILGRVLEAINSLLFIYLILLLGKGYTITRAKLSRKSCIRLTIFIVSYSLCFAILFVFEIIVFDPGQVLYIYESPGGYGILILRFVGWFMLIYAVGFTLKRHRHKIQFYVPFLLFYSLWFISGPILVLIITYEINNWVRETIATGVDLIISFLGHLFFLKLTWPTSANKNFPFHIKTTQVRALEQFGNVDDVNNPLTLENFTRHPYQVPAIKPSQRINDLLISKQVDLPENRRQFGSIKVSPNVSFHNFTSSSTPISNLTEIN